MARLVDASATGPRLVEARLSGFPWVPFRRKQEGSSADAPGRIQLRGAAGEVIAASMADRSWSARRAAAAAYLLSGDARRAVATLDALSSEPRPAAAWSDLAAAHYAIAVETGSPEHLERALAAADDALRLEPTLGEAVFNRSVVLQRFGLRDLARASWERYVAIDPSSSWANEARASLRALEAPPAFRDELDAAYAALRRGEAGMAADLVARFPQDARKWGEVEILNRWAKAAGSDEESAALHLKLARELGSALQRRSGESLLADAVAAIDHGSATQRAALVQAHLDYWNGRRTYQMEQPAAAETSLRTAADWFNEGASPLELVSSYYAANTVFDQNQVVRAEAELTRIADQLPARYRALRAQVQWQLALCAIATASWGRALELLQDSAATFVQLGETDNASAIGCIIADSYENLGEVALARRHRIHALARLGRVTNRDLQVALAGMTRTAIREHDWRIATSMINLELASAREAGNRMLEADALLRRTLMHLRQRDANAARKDLELATRVRSAIADPTLRERIDADQLFADGVAAALLSEPDAVEKISHAIDFHRRKGKRVLLPQLLFARARANKAVSNGAAAWNDLETAIAELEGQRSSLPAGDVRAGILATSTEIFEEAVAIQLARGNIASALQYSERGRARILLETGGEDAVHTLPSIAGEWVARIPRGIVAISYVPVGDSVHIFVVDRQGISATNAGGSSSQLRSLASSFIAAATQGDASTTDLLGGKLHAALLAPIAHRIAGAQEIVVTGDSELLALPFGALRDASTQRYLVEDASVIASPSIAVYLRLADRRRKRGMLQSPRLLAIGDPERDRDASLAASLREVRAVVDLYSNAEVLTGAAATRTAFARGLRTADIVHFAGHGRAGASDAEATILLAEQADDPGYLFASELQALPMPRLSVAVLAACETGQGGRRDSEGAWSIARSFLIAGVPSVVATLWPIPDDDAPGFFLRVHEHLLSGRSPAAAVRATQLEFMREKRKPGPSIWTAIQVIGS